MSIVLADLIAGVHVAYVVAVVLGLLLTLAGQAPGWQWVSNRWFRLTHLVLMAVAVIVFAALWQECPLRRGGSTICVIWAGRWTTPGCRVGRCLHDLIHPDLPGLGLSGRLRHLRPAGLGPNVLVRSRGAGGRMGKGVLKQKEAGGGDTQ